jgi:hypothetical protein
VTGSGSRSTASPPGTSAKVRQTFDGILRTATVGVWDKEAGEMVQRSAPAVLLDTQWMAGAGPRGMAKAAHRGRVAHDAIEQWAYAAAMEEEILDPEDPDLAEWVTATISEKDYSIRPEDAIGYVQAALRWLRDHVEEVILAEAPVFNFTERYAGTTDLMARLKGQDGVWLLDFKTSSSMTPDISHKLQLAAYRRAEFYGIRNTATLHSFPKADRLGNVYVFPDDRKGAESGDMRAVLKEWTAGNDEAYVIFRNLRTVHEQLTRLEELCSGDARIVKPCIVDPVSRREREPKPIAASPARRSREAVAA